MDHLCFLCLVFLMLLRLFIAALWSPAGKGLSVILLRAHPASFAHNFVSGMQFYFSESQDAIVLQTCH